MALVVSISARLARALVLLTARAPMTAALAAIVGLATAMSGAAMLAPASPTVVPAAYHTESGGNSGFCLFGCGGGSGSSHKEDFSGGTPMTQPVKKDYKLGSTPDIKDSGNNTSITNQKTNYFNNTVNNNFNAPLQKGRPEGGGSNWKESHDSWNSGSFFKGLNDFGGNLLKGIKGLIGNNNDADQHDMHKDKHQHMGGGSGGGSSESSGGGNQIMDALNQIMGLLQQLAQAILGDGSGGGVAGSGGSGIRPLTAPQGQPAVARPSVGGASGGSGSSAGVGNTSQSPQANSNAGGVKSGTQVRPQG